MSFYCFKTLVTKFYYWFFIFFIHLISNLFTSSHDIYECYHISKSYNFNTKLNYIFNNMEHQALVTLVVIRVTMTTPIWKCWDSLPCTLPHLWMCIWILVHSLNFIPFSFLSYGCELKVRVTTIKLYMFILKRIIGFGLVVATTYYINCWFP